MKTETKMTKAEVVSFEGRYLMLHLQYEVKDENSKRLVDIPLLEVPIYTEHLPIQLMGDKDLPFYARCASSYIQLNSDKARLCRGTDNNSVMTERILETYSHEMTIEEIEKALGYSVKIVKEKKLAIIERIIETYPHEMTIEEIEEALGYCVKIVKEKENDGKDCSRIDYSYRNYCRVYDHSDCDESP